MRQLYVCSKPLPTKDDPEARRPRLIGVLREIKPGVSPRENGEYEFEYKIGGEFHEYCLRLYRLPDPQKTYPHSEISDLITKFLPDPNNIWLDGVMETAGLSEYDEWEWLKYAGREKNYLEQCLYETLPDEVIRYE